MSASHRASATSKAKPLVIGLRLEVPMDETRRNIESIEGFWTREFALYLAEHRHPLNRLTHFFGVPIIVITPLVAVARGSWWIFVLGQVIGWMFQLAGHRIEGNRPALLKRPISMLLGPLMVVVELLEQVGLTFTFARHARAAVFSRPLVN